MRAWKRNGSVDRERAWIGGVDRGRRTREAPTHQQARCNRAERSHRGRGSGLVDMANAMIYGHRHTRTNGQDEQNEPTDRGYERPSQRSGSSSASIAFGCATCWRRGHDLHLHFSPALRWPRAQVRSEMVSCGGVLPIVSSVRVTWPLVVCCKGIRSSGPHKMNRESSSGKSSWPFGGGGEVR